ncbi:hypothetical protein JCM11491_001418 [Sporobolomyces phaffii]
MPVHSSHAASNAHLLRTLRRLKAKVTTAEAAYLTALNSNKEVWIRVHDPVTRQSSLESRGTVKEYYEELQERAQALLPALAGLPRQGLTNEQDAEAKEIVHAWSEFTRQGAGHELYKSREGVATAQRAVLGEYATMMHSRTERTGRKGRQGLVKTGSYELNPFAPPWLTDAALLVTVLVNKALKKMRAALEPLDERVRSEMMDQFNIIDILRYCSSHVQCRFYPVDLPTLCDSMVM